MFIYDTRDRFNAHLYRAGSFKNFWNVPLAYIFVSGKKHICSLFKVTNPKSGWRIRHTKSDGTIIECAGRTQRDAVLAMGEFIADEIAYEQRWLDANTTV